MIAYRSPIRLFVFGLLGLVLMLASIDVVFGHWISTEPENNDGVLTTRGQAQQRGDLLWGAVMAGTGTLLVVGAVIDLVRRQPRCRITSDGIELPMGAHEAAIVVPWGDIRSVRADTDRDPFDGATRPRLVIDVDDRRGLPDEPHGAEWFGSELHVDAAGWTSDVGELALAAQGALGHYRRVEEIKAMEPPSLTWQTTVGATVAPGGDPAPGAGSADADRDVDDPARAEQAGKGEPGGEEVEETPDNGPSSDEERGES